MERPSATVIVRTKDSSATVERAFSSLRRQTVPVELVVVDSGSRDDTLDVAARWCDRVLEIPADRYTSGRALNLGSDAASGEFVFALSSHSVAPRDDWIERALAHYRREDVAGVAGTTTKPDGSPLHGIYYEGPADARKNPQWGFSNHASSWRKSVWEQQPFREDLLVTEDKEWAWRVIDAGWVIAYDPLLWVDQSHRWRVGTRAYFQRERREQYHLGLVAELPPYTLLDAVREWWTPPRDEHSRLFHLLNYRRAAGLAGKYAGLRGARR